MQSEAAFLQKQNSRSPATPPHTCMSLILWFPRRLVVSGSSCDPCLSTESPKPTWSTRLPPRPTGTYLISLAHTLPQGPHTDSGSSLPGLLTPCSQKYHFLPRRGPDTKSSTGLSYVPNTLPPTPSTPSPSFTFLHICPCGLGTWPIVYIHRQNKSELPGQELKHGLKQEVRLRPLQYHTGLSPTGPAAQLLSVCSPGILTVW